MSNRAQPHTAHLSNVDPLWSTVRTEAGQMADAEPALASFVWETVLNHARLEDAVVHRIAERLDHPTVKATLIRQTYGEALDDEPQLGEVFRVDMQAVYDRDPACSRYIEPIFYFKGFHAIQTHRLAHWLWRRGRQDFALYLQSRASEVFQVDIHPAVPLGRGVFLDHGTGIVVGQTAVIEDDVSILQGVTLGGTGKETGDRHPKIRHGVLIGAGSAVLGNIEVGHCARVAAGSVVLKPVPPRTTVAGVPARVVGEAPCSEPSRAMDHMLGRDICGGRRRRRRMRGFDEAPIPWHSDPGASPGMRRRDRAIEAAPSAAAQDRNRETSEWTRKISPSSKPICGRSSIRRR